MRVLIIAGGSVDLQTAGELIEKQPFDRVVAADAGLESARKLGLLPDLAVGDFDSVSPEVLSETAQKKKTRLITLNPEKDDTDSEHALRTAIEMGADEIVIIGATGTRLDHVMGNMNLLGIGLEEGVLVSIADANNRIRMIHDRIRIRRDEQYGRYLSLIPYMGKAEKVTATGVKYPLREKDMEGFHTLGVSNEITGEQAEISLRGGFLLVIESRD